MQVTVAVLLSTLQLFKNAGCGEKGPEGRSLVTDQSTPSFIAVLAAPARSV